MTSEYRFAPGLLLRAVGLLLAVLGVVLVLVGVVVSVLDWPRGVLTAAVLVSVLVVVASTVGGLVLTRRVPLVRMDDAGYRVRLVRGAGTRRARWRDVEDVATLTVRGTKAVSLRLRSGTSTTVPVAVLDTDPERFVEDLRDHLDRAHGYRRLG